MGDITLTATQAKTLEQMLTLGIEFVRSLRQDGSAAQAAAQPTEPEWVAEQRRVWRFLKALQDAGGNVSAAELSRIAAASGYDPRGTGGFYTAGDRSMLRRDGDRRLLTDEGRRFIKKWRKHVGS